MTNSGYDESPFNLVPTFASKDSVGDLSDHRQNSATLFVISPPVYDMTMNRLCKAVNGGFSCEAGMQAPNLQRLVLLR